MMERVRFIEHRGRQILFVDLSHCESEDILRAIQATRQYIAGQPEHSLLALIDVTAAPFCVETMAAAKESTKINRPYVAASAIVGLNGVKRILLRAIEKYSGRTFGVFDDIEEAKDWLATELAMAQAVEA